MGDVAESAALAPVTPAQKFEELVDALANASSVAEVQRLRAELEDVIEELGLPEEANGTHALPEDQGGGIVAAGIVDPARTQYGPS